jgi:holo-[acyl-carrier protein] synthase
MIKGIGTDIVQISRFEKLLSQFDPDKMQNFIKKILSPSEIEQYLQLKSEIYPQFIAKRFAAKEAVAKALGTGIGIYAFKDIEIYNDDLGKPHVRINHPQAIDSEKIHLSISDDYPAAIAFVVIEK